jgi:hypothetical protein
MNKKLLISTIAACSFSLAASAANAGAVATSYLDVHDLFLSNGSNKLVLGTDLIFTGLVENNGDTNAELNGAVDSNHNQDTASEAGLDVLNACITCGTYQNNDFTFLTKPQDAPANYAVGDVLLFGAIIDFPDGGTTPDAEAQTLAEVAIAALPGNGSSSGNNVGVNARFEFIATNTTTIFINALADAYIRSSLTNDLTLGSAADASTNWSFSLLNTTTGTDVGITDLITGLTSNSYAPSIINTSRSATLPGDDFDYSITNQVMSASFGVLAGTSYQLTIDHASDANANATNEIPEPAPLALMSLGLIGLAWTKRRAKK